MQNRKSTEHSKENIRELPNIENFPVPSTVDRPTELNLTKVDNPCSMNQSTTLDTSYSFESNEFLPVLKFLIPVVPNQESPIKMIQIPCNMIEDPGQCVNASNVSDAENQTVTSVEEEKDDSNYTETLGIKEKKNLKEMGKYDPNKKKKCRKKKKDNLKKKIKDKGIKKVSVPSRTQKHLDKYGKPPFVTVFPRNPCFEDLTYMLQRLNKLKPVGKKVEEETEEELEAEKR